MFCPNCGKQVREKEKFCRYCGKPLQDDFEEADSSKEKKGGISEENFTKYLSPDRKFSLKIPKGWKVERKQIGIDEFSVLNPEAPEMFAWRWPMIQYFCPDSQFAQMMINFVPQFSEFLSPPISAMNYLKNRALPSFIQVAGEIEIVSEGFLDDQKYREIQLEVAYYDYKPKARNKDIQGRLLSAVQNPGRDFWFAIIAGYQSSKNEFESKKELFQFILDSYEIDISVMKEQQRHQQNLINIQAQSHADTVNTMQQVNQNNQRAMDRISQKWDDYIKG